MTGETWQSWDVSSSAFSPRAFRKLQLTGTARFRQILAVARLRTAARHLVAAAVRDLAVRADNSFLQWRRETGLLVLGCMRARATGYLLP